MKGAFVMKKLSLILALAMLVSCFAVPAMAEESVIKESASGFFYIEAEGERPRLSAASADKFFQVDGEWFKDMNGNGALDPYEDWRLPVEDRVADLTAQMTLDEKGGLLLFACIAGQNGSTVTDFDAEIAGFTGGNTDAAASASVVSLESAPINDPDNLTVEISGKVYRSTRYQIQTMYVNTFIAALTGVPKDQLDIFNRLQSYAEDTRLGIPATFSGDRSYDTWGGMIDMPHYALGVAHDPDLLYNLVSEYAKEAVAIGYHQVFHGYGNEIGSWYGDNPSEIALMSATETKAYEDNGFQSHSKHFIARGGRNSYANAKSPADLIDSWKIGWQAVVDAGTQYIMTNNNVGITPGVQSYMDKDTYDILRNELGYDGVVCLDWPLGDTSLMTKTGILRDGTDISTLSLVERYALILNAGVDMFSCSIGVPGTDVTDEAYVDIFMHARPQVIVQAVNEGLVTEEDLNVHVGRVLRTKFAYGLFDNPYRDWGELLELIGTDAYKAEQTVPLSTEKIDEYRRPEIIAMEQEVMVKSTVLLKNDELLPLAEGTKIFAGSNNTTIEEADRKALEERGAMVSSMEEADVVLIHVSAFNDAYDILVEDAIELGKPYILIFEGTVGRNGAQGEPYFEQVKNAAAVLLQTYNNTPDHGSSVGSFYRYVTPSITADMLFGDKDPAGTLVFEVPYEAKDLYVAWGELQNDIGVDPETRLYMAMLAKENPEIEMPRNLGNVLFTSEYGMSYAKPADIQLSLLTVEQDAEAVTTENNGRVSTTINVFNKVQKAGEPFEISFVARNNGGAGHVNVQVKDGEEVIAEKFVAIAEGAWRVITLEITLEAGEHTVDVNGLTTTITAE